MACELFLSNTLVKKKKTTLILYSGMGFQVLQVSRYVLRYRITSWGKIKRMTVISRDWGNHLPRNPPIILPNKTSIKGNQEYSTGSPQKHSQFEILIRLSATATLELNRFSTHQRVTGWGHHANCFSFFSLSLFFFFFFFFFFHFLGRSPRLWRFPGV